jgi:GT2 family glycosyltransferase
MLSGVLAAIVVNRNGGKMVLQCIQSLLSGTRAPDRLIVVDNHSTDASVEDIRREFPQARILERPRNEGYAAALNAGIADACRDDGFLLLMNNDVVLESRAVETLLEHWTPECGLIGPKVFRLGEPPVLECAWGSIRMNHVICRMEGEGVADSDWFSQPRDVEVLNGCLLLTSCSVVKAIGPLDADYFLYMEEVDYAFRVRQGGKRIRFAPAARIWHAGGHATDPEARRAVKKFYVRRNSVVFMRKHARLRQWPRFVLLASLSLASFLFTCRWSGFALRLRGYREGFRAPLGAASRSFTSLYAGRLSGK